MSLPFEPACRPVLLGGLPHKSAAQALEVSRRLAGPIVTWPQLAQRSPRESGLRQAVAGFPGLVVSESGRVHVDRARALIELDTLALAHLENNQSYGRLDEEHAAGLYELLRQNGRLGGALAVKGQLMGPISLAAQLTDERQTPLIYDDQLWEALAQHLRLRAMWLEAQLAGLGLPTIVCLDEPYLDALAQPFLPVEPERTLELLQLTLAGITGCAAIYALGNVNWQQLLETSAALLIADVHRPGTLLVAGGEPLVEFVHTGGLIGLGVVPIEPDEIQRATPDALVRRVEAQFAALERIGVDPQQLRQQTLLTTCGALGRLEVPVAEQTLGLLAETSALLRGTR